MVMAPELVRECVSAAEARAGRLEPEKLARIKHGWLESGLAILCNVIPKCARSAPAQSVPATSSQVPLYRRLITAGLSWLNSAYVCLPQERVGGDRGAVGLRRSAPVRPRGHL